MIRNFSISFTLLLLSLDVLAALIAVRLAELLRQTLPFGRAAAPVFFETPPQFYILIPLFWVVSLNMVGAYSPRATFRAVLELFNLIRATLIAIFIISGLLYLVHRDYSRLQAGYLILLLGSLTIISRGLLRLYFHLRGGRAYDSRCIAVVGTNDLARQVGRQVRSYAWTGLYLAGFVELTDKEEAAGAEELLILGDIAHINHLIDEHQIDEVIFAIRKPAHDSLAQLVEQLYEKHVNVRIAPDVLDFTYLAVTVEEINGLPLISVREPVLTPGERIIKRVIDVVVSSIALVFCLPLMAIIAAAIRLESKGSPVYVQERLGEAMKPFKMYKFRTMVQHADQMQAAVNHYDENGHLIHKTPFDPRVTRVGRFLRRTSLDELPQLFNVWKGDMSLVGPRPEIPWMVENYERWQLKRFAVPQGLTGWWQINGRAETPMHLATEDDLYYILHYSIMLDFLILLRTPLAVIGGRGAY